MDSPNSSDSNSDYDDDLAIEAKRALAYLQTKRKYRYVEFLAQGGYGWVALVYDDKLRRPLAIKCTSDTSEMELSWWIKLDHPNILPLLEYITLDTCTVFIMPAMRKDLWAVVNESQFYEEELSFGLCRVWLRDVASALAYLHSQFLCHLDLKLDNVFLKEDGYVCLGDFSLISDIREVPQEFHFLEIYQPPEYTQGCHGTAPDTASSASGKFGGDKADMWQYGILVLDLLTNMKLTGSKSSQFTLFQHDVWPVLQKILLHPEYLNYLLEEIFVNVIFKSEDLKLCHDFVKNILCLNPDERISSEDAKEHGFTATKWPQLPTEFSLPSVVVEHLHEAKPLPIEEMKDSNMTVDEVLRLSDEKKDLPDTPSIGALDVMKRKMKKMQKEKLNRRESIAMDAGTKLVNIKPAPSLKGLGKEPTPYPNVIPSKDKESTSAGKKIPSDKKEDSVKTSIVSKAGTGKAGSIKVTAIKKVAFGMPSSPLKKKKPSSDKDDSK